jgi:hypothetical protein
MQRDTNSKIKFYPQFDQDLTSAFNKHLHRVIQDSINREIGQNTLSVADAARELEITVDELNFILNKMGRRKENTYTRT